MNLAESDTGVDVGWNAGCNVGGCQPLTTTVFSSLTAGASPLSAANNITFINQCTTRLAGRHCQQLSLAPMYLNAWQTTSTSRHSSQTMTTFCLINVSGRSTYSSVHCWWQSISCCSRLSVQIFLLTYFSPPILLTDRHDIMDITNVFYYYYAIVISHITNLLLSKVVTYQAKLLKHWKQV